MPISKTVRPTCARRFDAADVGAVSARERIAFLERESAQFQRERDNLLASTSWKLTRPLRLVVRVVQRASRVAQVAFSLLRRARRWRVAA